MPVLGKSTGAKYSVAKVYLWLKQRQRNKLQSTHLNIYESFIYIYLI